MHFSFQDPAEALRQHFQSYAAFGKDRHKDGSHITLSQIDRWFKQAQVVDGDNITTTDTAFRNSILPGSLNQCTNLTSSTSTSSQIPPHQLRELVRERLTAEGIRLSAPPYTIPTVR